VGYDTVLKQRNKVVG